MTTITALELRNNLDAIARRVKVGERIQVTYRSQPVFTLEPIHAASDKPKPGSPEAVQSFLKRVTEHRRTIAESNSANPTDASKPAEPVKSTIELYHDMLDNDPKYS